MEPSRTAGNATVQWFENDVFVGEQYVYCCGSAMPGGESASGYWPNLAIICPECGRLWARAIYQYEFSYQPRVPWKWVAEARRCPEHGDGTFLRERDILDQCSPEILRREAILLLLRQP